MRFHPIFLLFFLAITVQAQRRTTAKSEITSDTPRPSRSRGRSRFAATPEYQSSNEAPTPSEPTSRRVVSRKRVPEHRAQQQPSATETIERRSFAPRPTTEATERRPLFVAAEIPERRAPKPATEATERRTVFAAAEIPERRASRPATEATDRRTAFSAAEIPERRAPRPEATERKTFKTVQKPAHGPSYQVEEVVDEGTHEPFRKFKKTRVLTESHFEAQNLPRRNSLKSIPAASEYPEQSRSTSVRTVKKLVHHEPTSPVPPSTAEADDFNSIDEPLDTTLKTLGADSSSEESASEESKEEIFKTQPVITTPKYLEAPKPQNGNRRGGVRRNPNTFTEATSAASRSRTRTRATKAPEFAFQAAPSAIPSRGSRRRVEAASPLAEGSRIGPSVFSAELGHNEGRSRTGRKIEGSAPEKITLELPSRVAGREKSREQRTRRNTTTKRTVDEPRKRSSPSSTFPSRGRSRSRDVPPIIDESKLEVLPLFETEPKIVNTGSITRGRSRDTNRADDSRVKTESNEVDTPVYTRSRGPADGNFATSATEDEIKISKPDRVTVSVSESRSSSSDPTSHRSPVRESVVSEVSEITSRRTVSRRKSLRGVIKPIEAKPKILVGKLVPGGSRGSRKSEINLNAVVKKKGSEEIDDADNYPEPFKALIKAKKGKKESRPSSEISAITNIVTSSSAITRSTTESVKEINDQENELEPKSPTPSTPLSRSTRNRPSHTTTTSRSSTPFSERRSPYKKSTVEVKSTAPTLFTTPLSRLSKYKGKNAAPSSRNLTSQKFDRNVSFRPREGYSTERSKKGGGFSGRRVVKNAGEPVPLSTKNPKYSTSYTSSDRSKYRNEFSRGAVVRSTTNAPRYIPTIPSAPYVPTVPTVTPSRTTVFETGEKDPDLGLEVISFNDPVRPVQSANLISDDYVSSTANSLSVALPLVIDGTTEKPVSIIERIINSITAISTSSPPSVPPSTASTTESASAILKLSPKKTRQLDSTDATQTYATTDKATTEKPTTIIERILSSLNAIQATDNTSSAQVRTDFNTLSFTTTPTPKTARPFTSRNTLPEHISTTVNPLSILDEITPEQALQKSTIGKLLEILNSMVTTTESPQNLVVVTPKSPSFFSTTINELGFSSELFSSTALPLISTIMPGTTSTTTLPESTSLSDSTTLAESTTLSQSTATSTLPNSSATVPSTTTVPSLVATSTETDPTTVISADLRNGDSESLSTSSTTTEGRNGDSEFFGTSSITIEGRNGDSEFLDTSSTTTEGQIITTPPSTTAQSGTEASSSTETTSFPSTTEVGLGGTTDTISIYSLLSTLPSLQKFEVSPGSVSVFSANDLSNAITPEDNLSTTITIASRFNFDNTGTTQSSTTTEDATAEPTTIESGTEGLMMTTTQDSTTTTESSTTVVNNNMPSSTTSRSGSTSTSSGSTESSTAVVNNTTSSSTSNESPSLSNRSGRLLNFDPDPVRNSIDFSTPSTTTSTTPDYYIFAILNDNTILRKKPPTVPNKNTPYLVVGVYPNNTVVRKYPNGTVVPMERIIRVDHNTRPTYAARALSLDSISTSTTPTETNIASSRTPQSTVRTESRFALPDTGGTTSTQGTTSGTTSTTSGTTSTTRGSTLGPDSTTASSRSSTPEVTTAEGGTTVGSVPADMVTLESSTVSSSTLGGDTNPTLETLSQLLLNGRTLEAFNDIVNSAKTSTTDTDTNQTPQGDQYTGVLNIQDLINWQNANTVFRGKPVTRPSNFDKLDLTTASPPSSTIASTTTETPTVATSEAATTPSVFKAESTTLLQDPITLSNDILGDQSSVGTIPTTPTTAPTTASPTTLAPKTTTASIRTSTIQQRFTSTPITTILSVPTPKPTAVSTIPTPTTFFPAFFTTLFPSLFTTETPLTKTQQVRSTRAPQVVRISAAPSVTETATVAARTTRASTKAPATTRRITTIATTTMPTTTTTEPTTTTRQTTTTRLTTTTTEPTTTTLEATVASTTTKRSEPATDLNTIEVTTVKKVAKKQLTEEQKENLRTLQKLEEEQAALLKQLSFLTSLNFGGANPGSKRTSKASKVDKPANDNLAERVIELALERDKAKSTSSEPTTTKQPTSIQDQLAAIDGARQPKKATPSIEDVLKQYNLSDLDINTTPKSTAYGKSTDAILASILKEQGIAPPTPKSLGDQIKQSGIFETTSKRAKSKPKPTTQRPPGPLMQGLNWLLNALAPTPQAPPVRKPAKPVKPKKPPVDQELLANSPTHITPVVTPAPPKSSAKQSANALTQNDIQKLIKQLEGLQKDPSKGALDLSQIKSIQNLINTDEGVVVMANGEHGATSRRTTTTRSATTQRRQERKLATRAPLLTVSNSVEDVEEVIPTTPKPMRPPIGFRPVPGVDDDSSESLIRSNLITAAVNVTKAISGFLGTALQGAAQSFQSLLGSGSSLGTRVLGNVASGSSAGPT